jgi:hypothetical protein
MYKEERCQILFISCTELMVLEFPFLYISHGDTYARNWQNFRKTKLYLWPQLVDEKCRLQLKIAD